jgi:lysozyme family protein
MAVFEIAAEKTLLTEGGYANTQDDLGGETNGGISKKAYPNLDIRALTRGQILEIYKRDYWDAHDLSSINNQAVANQVFDMFLNTRPLSAATCFQLAIHACGANIVLDGKMGDNTIMTANSVNQDMLLDKFRLARIRFYLGRVDANHTQQPFLTDWVRRSVS